MTKKGKDGKNHEQKRNKDRKGEWRKKIRKEKRKIKEGNKGQNIFLSSDAVFLYLSKP